MTNSTAPPQARELEQLSADLKARIGALVDAMVQQDEADVKSELEHFLGRARELTRRKLAMQGTKTDTRDLLGELIFSRLRRGFRDFLRSQDARLEIKAAEWVIGTWLAGSALSDFATALDRAILEAGSPRDFSFAGRADFISVEEVMQLLGSGKHTGCLSLEKADNRIDIYIARGLVVFLDPHHMDRRVLPSLKAMKYREISPEMMQEAETRHAQQGTPIFLALRDLGFFKAHELQESMRLLGEEVVCDFIREQGACAFFYRRMDELPAFCKEVSLQRGMTPILLEASKQLDDWRSLAKVFPDADAPVQPVPDMFAKIAALDLAVLEIKMLAQINGENSPKQLVPLMGLPLTEIYRMLTRFAKAGVVIAPGGLESLPEDSLGVEASMQLAFDALDANDDESVVSSALDKVLGDLGGSKGGGGGGGAGAGGGDGTTGKLGIELLDVKKKKRG